MSRYPFATSRICSHDEKDALAWCWISGSAIAGQCVCMLMHLRCCLHPSSTPACVLKELIDSGLGAKEKSHQYFFCSGVNQTWFNKTFKRSFNPTAPRNPTAEGQEAVEPINEPIRQSIGRWISRSCTVAIPLWSQRKENVWHHWLFLRLKGSV